MPQLRPFEFYRALSALRHVIRFQRFPIMWPQSVAEHSFYVGVLAGMFAERLRSLGHSVDERVVLWALWHDAAEAITGDTPHDIKRKLGEAFDVLEIEAEERLARLSRVYEAFPAPMPDSLEATLIKCADWVELLLYTATERRAGNYQLEIADQRIWTQMDTRLRERMEALGVGAWYAELCQILRAETTPGGAVQHYPPEQGTL